MLTLQNIVISNEVKQSHSIHKQQIALSFLLAMKTFLFINDLSEWTQEMLILNKIKVSKNKYPCYNWV